MRIENVNLTISDKFKLENVSAEFHEGINLIKGDSGKGKTTLLNIISGLIKPDSGEIIDFGQISYMFQDARLLPWFTISKNCKIREKEKGLGDAILDKLGLEEYKSSFPSELSGGMKKRASLAMTLCTDFDTVLLDEPFAGLDEDNAKQALSVIKEYTENKCVIMVSHVDVGEVFNAALTL